ncbi:flagellar protein FlaG [Thiomicrorhabdus sp. zzn3]|uniref:flagellar protein FlaG n=1 Tax=Thiomicrorhabdus sp. zzn3 TaxID=3039775 RepID=UPI0024373C87|nr:flagellar protein FlaG [Thiomicrorhabdus sp. zzn3]MDG6777624.1 flagellar protein FlaG [Thiomicrorhabdus sp. zzn3]
MADFSIMPPQGVENFQAGASRKLAGSEAERINVSGKSIQNKVDRNGETPVQTASETSQSAGPKAEFFNSAESKSVSQGMENLLENLNQQLEKLNNYLRFEKDEESDRMVIFIKNSETGEVIRQIPSEEFLAISKNIKQFLEMRQQPLEQMATPVGLITDEKA